MADPVKIDVESLNDLANIIVSKTGEKTGAGAPTSTKTSFGGGTKAVKGFSEAVISADNNLSKMSGALKDATSGLPVFGKVVAGLNMGIGAIEETADVYRTLSKVGAGASGSLFDIRIQSARARLPLEQFAGMVTRNSELLAGFEGSVEGGARTLAKIGDTLFNEGLVENFTNLGYSIEEATELTMKSMAMDRRAAALEGRSVQEQAAEAARYAKSLQVISKLTGKQADQLQDEMQAQMADGAVRAKMRMLEKQGITGATEANKAAMEGMAAGSAAQKLAMKEILTLGAPVSQAAKNFVAANGAAAELMYQTKAAIESGDAEGAKDLSKKSLAAAIESGDSMANLQIATLRSVSEFGETQAQVLEETAAIVDQTIIAQKKAAQNNEEFATLGETFLKTLNKLNTNVNNIAEGTAVGQEALMASNRVNEALVNTGAGIQQTLAEGAKTNSSLNATLTDISENADKLDISAGVKKTGEILNNAMGTTQAEMVDKLQTLGMEAEAKQLEKMVSSDTSDADKKKIKDALISADILNESGENLTTEILNKYNKTVSEAAERSKNNTTLPPGTPDINPNDEEESTLSTILRSINKLIPDVFKELGGPVQSGQLAMVGEQGPELFRSNTAGNIISNQDLSLATLGPELSSNFTTIANQMKEEMKMFGTPITQAAKEAMATGITPESLQQMEDAMQEVKTSIAAPDSASNPDLIKLLTQLVEVNKKTNDIQRKHFRVYDSALKGIR